ncbi:hypothetical protein Sjap_024241 [Stephania japonica]|uniref:Uncharacterized protein n=1 Tax=Stephania japonica TaxID=461633 RepID=A0AAP0HLB2_9MAGN
MVVLICGLGIKMMMDQLIRGPGFMPPPQARPPMAPNLTDHSPNSSNKVRKQIDYYFSWILIHGFSHVMQAIGAVFALATVSIPTMNAFRRLATSMDKFSKVASEEVPGTLSSLKLSGLEINDLTQQLSKIRHPLRSRHMCMLHRRVARMKIARLRSPDSSGSFIMAPADGQEVVCEGTEKASIRNEMPLLLSSNRHVGTLGERERAYENTIHDKVVCVRLLSRTISGWGGGPHPQNAIEGGQSTSMDGGGEETENPRRGMASHAHHISHSSLGKSNILTKETIEDVILDNQVVAPPPIDSNRNEIMEIEAESIRLLINDRANLGLSPLVSIADGNPNEDGETLNTSSSELEALYIGEQAVRYDEVGTSNEESVSPVVFLSQCGIQITSHPKEQNQGGPVWQSKQRYNKNNRGLTQGLIIARRGCREPTRGLHGSRPGVPKCIGNLGPSQLVSEPRFEEPRDEV